MAATWFVVSHRLGAKSYRHCVSSDDTTHTIGDVISKDLPVEWDRHCVVAIDGRATESGQKTVIKADMPIDAAISFGLRFINVECAPAETSAENASANSASALDILMNAARNYCHLPSKRAETTAKNKQYNRLLDLLQGMKVGFLSTQVDTIAIQILNAISDALWYIDAHHDKFEQRSIPIVSPFDEFKGFNDFVHNHKAKPMLTSEGLKVHLDELARILMLPWFSNSKFKEFRMKVDALAKAFKSYLDYLTAHSQRQAAARSSTQPVRSLRDNWLYKVFPGVAGPIRAEYDKLAEDISEVAEYKYMHLLNYEPDDRFERREWLDKLQLPCSVAVYTYQQGGNLRNLNFIWRTRDSGSDDDKMIQVVTEIRAHIPLYSTRTMRRQFIDRYTPAGIKPAVLRDIYRYLTQDESSAESSRIADVDSRVVSWLANSDDPDLFYDLRKLNGRPHNTLFNPFWEELQHYLDETCTVNDRRHDELMYLPFAMSVRDLKEIISDRLPEDTPAPSVSWIRLNFSPQNCYNKTALNYTGRFNVKYAVQQRLLRQEHEDQWFCGHLWKMLRHMAIKWRSHATLVCVDDKSIVPVGEPGVPISTGVRAHHGAPVVCNAATLAAADHDFHTCGLVPSVTFHIDIPEVIEDGFYTGNVYVSLKDKIFSPSSAARHAGEMIKLMRETQSNNEVDLSKPVLFVFSDGGPDHRTNFISVKVAAVLVFMALDLDMYVAVRTAPHASWVNPAERIMSTLNIALQNVALMRDKMDDDSHERAMKARSTMKSVRTEAGEHPDFGAALKRSMEPVIDLLKKRFSRLRYKGDKVNVVDPAQAEDMIEVFTDLARIIDADLSVTSLEDVSKLPGRSPAFKTFMTRHTRERHYSFQVQKCSSADCMYCTMCPPRLPAEEFEDLHFLPDPIFDKKNSCYVPFNEVYGKHTTDDDRPSLQKKKFWSTSADQTHKAVLKGEKARDFVECCECGKRRVVYSKSRLNARQVNVLKQLKEEMFYVCGSHLFPEDSIHHHTIVVREGLRCSSEIESTYYSGAQTVFDPCCVHCGDPEDLVQNDEIDALREDFGIVRPICEFCFTHGKKPLTRNAKKGKKRAQHEDDGDDN